MRTSSTSRRRRCSRSSARSSALGHRAVRLGRPHDLLDARWRRASVGDRRGALASPRATARATARRGRPCCWRCSVSRNSAPMRSRSRCRSTRPGRARSSRRRACRWRRAPSCASRAGSGDASRRPAVSRCFVKPRWEGTAKGIDRGSRVATRAALVAEVGARRARLPAARAGRALPRRAPSTRSP